MQSSFFIFISSLKADMFFLIVHASFIPYEPLIPA